MVSSSLRRRRGRPRRLRSRLCCSGRAAKRRRPQSRRAALRAAQPASNNSSSRSRQLAASRAGARNCARAARPPAARSRPSASRPIARHTRRPACFLLPANRAIVASPRALTSSIRRGSASASSASASREARMSAGVSALARPKPPLKWTLSIFSRKCAKSAKLGVERGLGIALQIAQPRPRVGATFDPAAERQARVVEGIAALGRFGEQQRRARVAGEVPGVAGQRRHQEQRRAVEIARHADQGRQRRAAVRLQRRQGGGAGEAHQPFGVGDGPIIGALQVGGSFHHRELGLGAGRAGGRGASARTPLLRRATPGRAEASSAGAIPHRQARLDRPPGQSIQLQGKLAKNARRTHVTPVREAGPAGPNTFWPRTLMMVSSGVPARERGRTR